MAQEVLYRYQSARCLVRVDMITSPCRRKRRNMLFTVFRVTPTIILFREHFFVSSQQATLHANANHCLAKQTYFYRKNKVIPVEKTRSISEFFSKLSHLNEIYAIRYQIWERHAYTRGQITWLNCFEQKYLSYI